MNGRRTGVLADLVLFVWAALCPYHPVEDWLMRHKSFVYWSMGGVHLAIIPWLVLWYVLTSDVRGTRLQHGVFGSEESPLGKVFLWSFMLFVVCSWMIPIFLGFSLHAGTSVSYFTFLFGPYALLGIAGAGLVHLDKRKNYALSRQGAQPSPWAQRATFLIVGSYLCLTETSLFCIMMGRRVLSDTADNAGLCIALTAVSYVPTRLALFQVHAKSRLEFATLTIAFLHLLYRLLQAGGSP
jgi:hypothetical protein